MRTVPLIIEIRDVKKILKGPDSDTMTMAQAKRVKCFLNDLQEILLFDNGHYAVEVVMSEDFKLSREGDAENESED